ncbi:hydrogenase (NiFe) small subunit HydA [Denitrovibrio acetiphilus DSM 12809]|uniref:Hydrogenase (NiFe) small subunit HydA n=1 Tax=Denitrovibrio acetiphilus (strain DSM 12809 / NBRC 114555 / N2460) TaxID=522772 RepID=D4H4H8_DENA2|nr:hydrogenase small subunit [Denitrovibrio acetiphilus]ADD69307.1 hydrogenase (NiFe) small subunit HydA [Denitrovibrio acetiphilus DSM 12809]
MLSRRDFLKRCRDISAVVFGAEVFGAQIAEGFMKIQSADRPQLVFIQGQSCTGCSTSLMYGNETDFIDFIMKLVRVQVHPNLSLSQGNGYLNMLDEVTSAGGHILVLEGSIPAEMKKACMLGEEPLYDALKKHLEKASAVVASGSCSCFGGIPASGANETGAIDIVQYMRETGISKPLIKIPGCPVHPDRLMGTVAYILGAGKMPDMEDGIPVQYFGDLIHNNCTRFQYFSQDIYLEDYAKDKHSCLLKKGCRGTITKSDCALRRWNGGVNVCVESNAPCVGCINEKWPFKENIYLKFRTFEIADFQLKS